MKNTSDPWKAVMGKLMYFLYTILPAASRRPNWTKEGVDRALAWGQYCEKAVTHLRHRGSLQASLTMLARQSQHMGSFRDLLKARHMLLELLLKNNLLEEDVRKHVQQVSQHSLGAEFVSHAKLAVQQQQQHAKSLLRMLSESKYNAIHSRLRVELMLEAASNAEPEQVGECLAKVAHSPASLQAIFTAALLEEGEAIRKAGPAVVKWVEEVMTSPQHRKHRLVLGCLYSLPPQVLSKALAKYPQLVMAFLECVHRDALTFKPSYDDDDDGCQWLNCGLSVLSWGDLVRTYAVLVNHKAMSISVQGAVEGWSMLEGGAVWGEITRQARATCLAASHSASDSVIRLKKK